MTYLRAVIVGAARAVAGVAMLGAGLLLLDVML